LKQELDIDFHKISPEELYQRFQTHPENVSKRTTMTMRYNFVSTEGIVERCKERNKDVRLAAVLFARYRKRDRDEYQENYSNVAPNDNK